MLKNLITAIMILIGFLFQTTLFNAFGLNFVVPNVMLLLTFLYGFVSGQKAGMYVGLFCGLLIDLFYGDVVGFHALLYMYVGYINGFFHRMFYEEEITLPLILLVLSDLLYNFVYYLFAFMLRNRLDLSSYFLQIVFPELFFTLLITVVIYRPALWLKRKLDTWEQRSESNIG